MAIRKLLRSRLLPFSYAVCAFLVAGKCNDVSHEAMPVVCFAVCSNIYSSDLYSIIGGVDGVDIIIIVRRHENVDDDDHTQNQIAKIVDYAYE